MGVFSSLFEVAQWTVGALPGIWRSLERKSPDVAKARRLIGLQLRPYTDPVKRSARETLWPPVRRIYIPLKRKKSQAFKAVAKQAGKLARWYHGKHVLRTHFREAATARGAYPAAAQAEDASNSETGKSASRREAPTPRHLCQGPSNIPSEGRKASNRAIPFLFHAGREGRICRPRCESTRRYRYGTAIRFSPRSDGEVDTESYAQETEPGAIRLIRLAQTPFAFHLCVTRPRGDCHDRALRCRRIRSEQS